MSSADVRRRVMLGGVAVLLLAAPAAPQGPRGTEPVPRSAPSRPAPRLEPVAETRLLMEGLAYANYRGLERLLRQRPADVEDWTFARGQALLIGETGNLLMLRPPRNAGEAVWLERATELRERATSLARFTAARDYEASRAAFENLAASCNRCHQTFRVPVRLTPFGGPERKVNLP
ncbi:MAG TPA: cytochrome c [Gemmataceae bacterium]|nr:cytochrome c [Gemmataceae bacterium]